MRISGTEFRVLKIYYISIIIFQNIDIKIWL